MEADNENPLDGLTEHSKEWWAAVYGMHHKAAWSGALGRLRSESTSVDSFMVADIVQEVFVRLQAKRSINNNTENMGGYIRRCAHNLADTKAGRQSKLTNPTGDEEGEAWDTSADDEDLIRVDDVDELTRQAEHVVTKLDTLTDQERRVLRQLRNSTREEIGLREGVSKARITQVKNEIKRKLRVDYGLRSDGTRMETDD